MKVTTKYEQILQRKLNYALNYIEFIDDHMQMYPNLQKSQKLKAIRSALTVDVEEVKRRIAEAAKIRKMKEALAGEKAEEDDKNVQEKNLVKNAKETLDNEIEKVRREKAALEKLKRSLGGMIAASDGMRAVQMDRETFNCPICRSVLRIKNGQDVCVRCGIHFTY